MIKFARPTSAVAAMCSCRTIVLEDIAYRGVGLNAVPYHKVCGDWLSNAQVEQIERQRAMEWPRPWAESFRRPRPRAVPEIQYCPDCGGALVDVRSKASVGYWCRKCKRFFEKPVRV